MPTPEEIEQELVRIEAIAEADRTPMEAVLLAAGRKSVSEHMIPKTRLDEALAAKKKAEGALAQLQKAEDDRKKQELSELDRLKLEVTEKESSKQAAERQLAQERMFNRIVIEANKSQFTEAKLKFVDPETVYRLLDITAETTLEAIPEMLKKLAESKPFLLEQPVEQKGDGNGTPRRRGKQVSAEDLKNTLIEKKRSTYQTL